MNCLKFDQFMKYLYNDVTKDEAILFHAHLERCTTCRSQLEMYQMETALLDTLSYCPPLPESFASNVMAAIEGKKPLHWKTNNDERTQSRFHFDMAGHENEFTQPLQHWTVPDSELGIERPVETRQQRKRRAQQSRRKRIKIVALASTTMFIAASMLGAYMSPTFAAYVKSLFLFYKSHEGTKQAAQQGHALPIDMKVTDKGYTLIVKEALLDPLQLSIAFRLHYNGKPVSTELVMKHALWSDPPPGSDKLVPPINTFELLDESNKPIQQTQLSWSQHHLDTVLQLPIHSSLDKGAVKALNEIPDKVYIKFNVNQIGDTNGMWHVKVPIDIQKAKAASNWMMLDKSHLSPLGLDISLLQLRHGPSRSELFLHTSNTEVWAKRLKDMKAEQRQDIMLDWYGLFYQIKDQQGNIVAAWDGMSQGQMQLGHKNIVREAFFGSGGYEQHSYLPFGNKQHLIFELKSIYTNEPLQLALKLHSNAARTTTEPLTVVHEGTTIRVKPIKQQGKQDITTVKLVNGSGTYKGEGFILEMDMTHPLGTALYSAWTITDEKGTPLEYTEDLAPKRAADGSYHIRKWFFFEGMKKLPQQMILKPKVKVRSHTVDWSTPLPSKP
ncbi:DUF4179 domain-containing protein [Paenibacillus sp. 481]|uniref:DUF4179 domain-containing protein n=1 Tax=Paenibacillus sp. 481 TaxID=2835869 RepID=UPI001E300353|nr:DUF4179 domain-containing protein [Paenibacillus sp. 481]UHA74823.1 DUF4179 domain-containing protein [Paenibacillus sp. 481]